jgi:catechol 2,3-dioxygenase-like lactoylglutathione lyase family enzyme
MIDHVTLNVSDYQRSKHFYEEALAPLGFSLQMEFGNACGFGVEGMPFFWIGERQPAGNAHVAFRCEERAPVEAFHAAALGAGGSDNGAPGLRAHYHPNYYAAFVHDPDANNVEAVCHTPA